MHAKAHGAHHLHRASRGIDTIEHFVMWSSIVAAAGNEGTPTSGLLCDLPVVPAVNQPLFSMRANSLHANAAAVCRNQFASGCMSI